ncbi:MAG: ribbon-helix-helix protein, CopG family [Acidimicrobiales bacterium]
MSIRFRRTEVREHLKAEAGARHMSSSALAEELIEEGLRTRRHPLIVFRDGPSGRRAGLIGGPDIWEIIGGLVGGDVPAEDRIERAVNVSGLTPSHVSAALDYYADFNDEIDGEIAANLAAADEAEAAWRRRQGLLAG